MINKILNLLKLKKKFSSKEYWETRYVKGGNSGSGSYNELARFKSSVINNFVNTNSVSSIIEFGCGDGNQLKLYNFEKYLGLDVSETIIKACKTEYKNDFSKKFKTLKEFQEDKEFSELSLSIDVIYHLIEDKVFENHLNLVFNSSTKFVIIYSTNFDGKIEYHERNREFTKWIDKHILNWKLIEQIKNIYPFDSKNPDETSNADFFIYKKSN